jgi:hypothetical protein
MRMERRRCTPLQATGRWRRSRCKLSWARTRRRRMRMERRRCMHVEAIKALVQLGAQLDARTAQGRYTAPGQRPHASPSGWRRC